MTPLLAEFELLHPARLLLLAALPVFLYLSLRRGPRTLLICLSAVVRAAVVGMLLIAFAGPVQLLPGFAKHVVLVADFSDSTAGSRDLIDAYVAKLAAASGVKSSLVAFGTEQLPASLPADFDVHLIDSTESDPAAAVLLADTLLPDDSRGEIVLLTDGRQTAGDLAAAIQGVRAPISVVPLAPFAQPEVCLHSLQLVADAPLGEETTIEAVILANQATTAELHVAVDGSPAVAQQLSLQRGRQRVTLAVLIDRSNAKVVTAEVKPAADTFAANNHRRQVVPRRGDIRVLVIDPQPNEVASFAVSLTNQGLDVATAKPAEVSFQLEALNEFDVIVLSDVSAAMLTNQAVDVQQDASGAAPPANALAALDAYAREGGGLIVAGGADVFGVEVLTGTPLEDLLPLKASPREAERKPTLALVLVIDKSKSMLDDDRLKLAKAAARQTVDELEPNDKVGVMAFGTDNAWVSEIVPAGDKRELKQRIDTLEAAGQTDMYPALEKAYLALEQADADRRHAIVLTDGVSTPGDFGEIARRMAEAGVTVSTVSISPGAEQQILRDIARIAGGEHYHCDRAEDIADILVRDTRRVEAAALEYAPIVHHSLPGLDLRGAPPLLGFAPTSPHGGAQLLLRSESGDPLLAWRRHVLGMAVAFPADVKNRWSERWQTWPGFGRFWSRVVTFARRRQRDELRLALQRTGNRVIVSLDARRDGRFLNGLAPSASVNEFVEGGLAGAPPQSLVLTQISPGRYEGAFGVAFDAAYDVKVQFVDEQGAAATLSLGGSYDYADELMLGPADEALLHTVAAQSAARFAPSPDELLTTSAAPRSTPTGLWRYFLLAAAVLLAVDIALRRLPHVLGRTTGDRFAT